MNDASNAESNDHENNENDEDNDFNECATSPLNEGSAKVDPQTQTIPIIANQSANRNVKEVICGDTKLKCQDCERVFSARGALWRHTKSKHGEVKYACNQCDYQATRSDHLTAHIQSIHEGVFL